MVPPVDKSVEDVKEDPSVPTSSDEEVTPVVIVDPIENIIELEEEEDLQVPPELDLIEEI